MDNFARKPATLDLNGNLSENWRRFKQNYSIFMKASEKDSKSSDIKASILLSLAGEEAVELFNTFGLSEADSLEEEKILDTFEAYCNPKKNVVYERYKFYKRDQLDGENFEQFLAEIKKLSQSCEFKVLLDKMIRDRIVIGINDENLQERMLRTTNLDLKKAIDCCRAAEVSKKQAKSLQEKTVDAVQKYVKEKKNAEENFLDTGAEVNVLPYDFYKNLNINKELLPTNIKLEAFGGSIIKPLVVEDISIPLLGVQTCESLNLVKRVSNIEFMSSKECFVKNNQDIFNGVDLKEGFWQVELDSKSSDLCTFSTPFGCWKFLRLPYGLNMAPEYFQYINKFRNTPLPGINLSPAQLVFNRITRSKLPVHSELLKSENSKSVHKKLVDKQIAYKNYHDKSVKARREFNIGENALVRRDKIWEPSKIIKKHQSPRSYIIQDQRGNILRRNSAHLGPSQNEYKLCADPDGLIDIANNEKEKIFKSDSGPDSVSQTVKENISVPISVSAQNSESATTTRSGRNIKVPERFKDFVRDF
ncbi:hypothetical protein NQ317_014532 [Molorchus minor]|uniref:Uncharacterized protein n=1 Tax=Molorchus minor TaxID=1323400 RepID=A0ABQ9JBZ3_9CUCU|nr:hypothetical protein NQ317_014532 [Molorchus minor]